MLPPVARLPVLVRRDPQETARLQVIVPTLDVGEAVMQDMMLVAPQITAGAQDGRGREADRHIDAAVAGDRAMIGVMKDVETDGAGGQAVGKAQRSLQPDILYAEQQDERTQKP